MYNYRIKYTDEFIGDYILDLIARGELNDSVFQEYPDLYSALRNSMARKGIKGNTTDFLYTFTPFRPIPVNDDFSLSGQTVFNLWKIIMKIGTLKEEALKTYFNSEYSRLKREMQSYPVKLNYEQFISLFDEFKPYLSREFELAINETDYLTEVLVNSLIVGQITSMETKFLLSEYLSKKGSFDGVVEQFPDYIQNLVEKLPPFGRLLTSDVPYNYYVTGGKRNSKSLLSIENLGLDFIVDCLYRVIGKVPCESVRPSLVWKLRHHYDQLGHFCFLFRLNPELYMELFAVAERTNTTIKDLILNAGLPYTDMYLEDFFVFGMFQKYIGIRSSNSDSATVIEEIMVVDIPRYNKLQPYLPYLRFEYDNWAGKSVPMGFLQLQGEAGRGTLKVHEMLYDEDIKFNDGQPLNMLSSNLYRA